MEGVTDSAFRQLCKEYGADVVYTEFISSDAIGHRGKSALAKLAHSEIEQPAVCQIFGHDPVMFATAAKAVERAGFAGLDINFGCPARKVVTHGSGAALLREPSFARTLVESALQAVNIPVSIKVRASIRKNPNDRSPDAARATALDLIRAVEGLPVAAIMIHGRTYEQGFNGDIDLDMIRAVKNEFPGIVLANGGITTPERAQEVLTATGADGVGVARGSWGRPWVFRQVKEFLRSAQYQPVTWIDIRQATWRHAELLGAAKGAHGLIEFRKHFAHALHHLPGAAAYRARAVRVNTLDDVRTILDEIDKTAPVIG